MDGCSTLTCARQRDVENVVVDEVDEMCLLCSTALASLQVMYEATGHAQTRGLEVQVQASGFP